MSDRELAGKVAIVTGGGTGIGHATAIAFAREGARVVVADVVDETGEATVAAIVASGGEARYLRTDVSDPAAVEALVERTVAWYGQLDFAYNNAGILVQERLLADIEDDAWDRIMAVNLKGVFLCMKHEICQMLRQETGGSIVNCASTAAFRTIIAGSSYSATKAGVAAITRVAAAEYGPSGIRINAIAPAGIDTPMLAKGLGVSEERRQAVAKTRVLRRLGSAEEAAEAVLFLCSGRASYITGHTLMVDGGVIAAP
jgi:NAD(P)-dependent dehydrogenase (short-subunit alcohol dehydrogenase family)